MVECELDAYQKKEVMRIIYVELKAIKFWVYWGLKNLTLKGS